IERFIREIGPRLLEERRRLILHRLLFADREPLLLAERVIADHDPMELRRPARLEHDRKEARDLAAAIALERQLEVEPLEAHPALELKALEIAGREIGHRLLQVVDEGALDLDRVASRAREEVAPERERRPGDVALLFGLVDRD